MGMPEVFDVTIALGATASILAKRSCLGLGCSMMTSQIQSQSARRPMSSSVLPMVTNDARSVSMNDAGLLLIALSRPLLAGAERSGDLGSSDPGISRRTTGIPAEAQSAAIPWPITPAPMTPTLDMRISSYVGLGTSIYRVQGAEEECRLRKLPHSSSAP